MRCDEVSELAAAYALDALDPDETAAVEAHLATCERHEEIVDYRAAALALGALIPPDEDLAGAGLADGSESAGSRFIKRSGRRLLPQVQVQKSAIAAVLAVGIFLMGWVASALSAEPSADRWSYVYRSEAGSSIRLSAVEGEPAITVGMSQIEPVPDDSTYQLWAIREGRWMSLGVMNPGSDGEWNGEFPFELQPRDEVALTIEEGGGSDRPRGRVLMRTPF